MFRKKDLIIYISVLLLAGAAYLLSVFIRNSGNNGTYARVSVDGSILADYPLNEDTEVILDGCFGGSLKMIISDGTAFVESSSCPDKICVRHRAVSHAGESIICMPNRIIIEIISDSSSSPENNDAIDAVSINIPRY